MRSRASGCSSLSRSMRTEALPPVPTWCQRPIDAQPDDHLGMGFGMAFVTHRRWHEYDSFDEFDFLGSGQVCIAPLKFGARQSIARFQWWRRSGAWPGCCAGHSDGQSGCTHKDSHDRTPCLNDDRQGRGSRERLWSCRVPPRMPRPCSLPHSRRKITTPQADSAAGSRRSPGGWRACGRATAGCARGWHRGSIPGWGRTCLPTRPAA